MYGGGASGASLGYGENHATSESETNHNSNLNIIKRGYYDY